MWILGTIAVSRNVLRRGTPVPSRIATPNRSSPLSSAPSANSVANLLWTSQPPKEPLIILQVPATNPTRRSHMLLGDRAPRFSVVLVLLISALRYKSTISGVMFALLRRRAQLQLPCL